ncbi:MAG TPA: hypothetical protein VGC13_19955 [Longimicrobium sp.]|uniref:hypothetical protein n=1 Tax=Longimicrobium sp. TaxID=2029185 RepID=UPI002ED773B8
MPNVYTNTPFDCPYCKTHDLHLYKCLSCTSVSIFDTKAVPQACPQCPALVRSPPFKDSDWLYHIAPRSALLSIQANGLRSVYSRTRRREPEPSGSFVADREKRIEKIVKERLSAYVAHLDTNANLPDLPNFPVIQPTILFDYTASQDDYARLKYHELEWLGLYARRKNIRFQEEIKSFRRMEWKTKATALLDEPEEHYLTLLAKEAANHHFGIEGAITASYVYFLATDNVDDMTIAFNDYVKLRAPGSYVVLRVWKYSVVGLERDQADHRAVRTQADVSRENLQIMIGTQNPGSDFVRLRSLWNHWIPLSQWRG